MIRLIFLITTTLSISNLFAQYTEDEFLEILNKSSENELVKESAQMIERGYLAYAEQITDKLIKLKPESANYNYRKGYILTQVKADYLAAIPYLLKAIPAVNKTYDSYTANEKGAPINAYYFLGVCYQFQGKFTEAREMFSKFKANSMPTDPLNDQIALRLIQCENADKLIKNPINSAIVKPLSTSINSAYPEYASFISMDGTSLFFTSYLNPKGNWSESTRLSICKPNSNEASIFVEKNERGIYLYNDLTGGGDIYYVDLSQKNVNQEKVLTPNLNTENWETHISLNYNQNVMYFVSDRPGGFGGRDIYKMVKDERGFWGSLQNLGEKINSKYDEDAPFIAADGKLYFSSNGTNSAGGFDIFVSELDKDGNWTMAKNLGFPINSLGDDLYFTTTLDGKKGYYSSSRQGGNGDKDIYEVTYPDFEIKDIALFQEKLIPTQGDLPADISIDYTCLDCKTPDKGTLFPRLRDGLVLSSFQPCRNYELIYRSLETKKELYKETITTKCKENVKPVNELVYDSDKKTITPANKEIAATLQTLPQVSVVDNKIIEKIYYFKYNDSKLSMKKSDFRKYIRLIEKQLKKSDKNITIKIYASASKVPTVVFESNQALAELRAENIKYDIITNFQNFAKYMDRVNVVIVSAVVDGPPFENDPQNTEKYKPYQHVKLVTE
jgi:tetratricopeptide (TPR) repeat protein